MKPRLHISLLAAASLLTFALGAPLPGSHRSPVGRQGHVLQ